MKHTEVCVYSAKNKHSVRTVARITIRGQIVRRRRRVSCFPQRPNLIRGPTGLFSHGNWDLLVLGLNDRGAELNTTSLSTVEVTNMWS
jgi:hypothetical protein